MTQPLAYGLDLSIAATGVCLEDGRTLTFRTDPQDGDERLIEIRTFLSRHIDRNEPTLVAIEDIPPVRAKAASITGMVQGVVRTCLRDWHVPYALIPPASVKKYATGRGNAEKPDLRLELYKRTGLDIRDNNQVDAWWLRAMALDHLGAPPVAMPQTHRAALTKVAWPDTARSA